MSNPPCTCTPKPPHDWVKGVCVKCWTWAHNPALKASRKAKARKQKPKSLPCIHVGEKLTMAEIKAINEKLTANDAKAATLNQSRSWHWCKVGLTANRAGVPGACCFCEGCGPKCPGYSTGESQNVSPSLPFAHETDG